MKLTRLIPAAVAAAALLAGCSPTPSTALVVNGTTVTESQIDTYSRGCAQALGIDQRQIVRKALVQTILIGEIMAPMLKEAGVTDEQVDAFAAKQGGQAADLIKNDECKPFGRTNLRVAIVSQTLDKATWTKLLDKASVSINPKYGRFDPEGTQSILTDSGSISIASEATLK